MKIYLDMCSLQRPLDNKTQLRVLVEAQAILGVLALCESGTLDLIASDALVFESDANPDVVRRDFAEQAMANATQFVKADDQVKARAQTFIDGGIKPMDALHLASAIAAQADFLCTDQGRFAPRIGIGASTMTTQLKPLSEVNHQAIRLLSEQIGVVDTFRFVNQFTTGHGNYTEERDATLGHLTLAEIVAAIEKKRSGQLPN